MAKRSYKVMTKDELVMMNNYAIRRHANKTLVPERVAQLPADKVYPVTLGVLHNDDEVRCIVVLNDDGDDAMLDLPVHTYLRLREVEVEEEQENE